MRNFRARLFLAVITLLLLLAARIPFLNQPLLGEEGIFSIIVTGYSPSNIDKNGADGFPIRIKENCYQVIAHIKSSGDTVIGPSRNIVPYCFLGFVIKPLIANFKTIKYDFDSKSILIRSTFLGISSLGFIALSVIAYKVSKRSAGLVAALPYIFLLFFATSKLALGSSIQPQIDGVFGFMLLSNAALLIYLGALTSRNNSTLFYFNIAAGFLMALCKVEWPLVLFFVIGAVLFIWLISMLYKISKGVEIDKYIFLERLSILSGLTIGAIAGMYACYLFSPPDYLSGISLMKSINDSKSDQSYIEVINMIKINYEILTPIFLMIIVGTIGIFKNKKHILRKEIGLFILFLWSIGVLLGFLQSGWIGDGFPRYFLPSLLISGIFAITQSPHLNLNGKWDWKVILFIALLIGITIFNYNGEIKKYYQGRSITVPGNYYDYKNLLIKAQAQSTIDPYGVSIIGSAIRYYYPEVNFISIDIGMNDIVRFKLPNARYHLLPY